MKTKRQLRPEFTELRKCLRQAIGDHNPKAIQQQFNRVRYASCLPAHRRGVLANPAWILLTEEELDILNFFVLAELTVAQAANHYSLALILLRFLSRANKWRMRSSFSKVFPRESPK